MFDDLFSPSGPSAGTATAAPSSSGDFSNLFASERAAAKTAPVARAAEQSQLPAAIQQNRQPQQPQNSGFFSSIGPKAQQVSSSGVGQGIASFARGIAQPFIDTGTQAVKQAKYLFGKPATAQQQASVLANQTTAQQNPEYMKAIQGIDNIPAQARVQAQKMAVNGSKAPEIRSYLSSQSTALTNQYKKGAGTAAEIASFAVAPEIKAAATGGNLLKSATINAAGGAVGSAGAQEANNTSSTAKDILKAAGTGAALGAVVTGAGGVVGKIGRKIVSNTAKSTPAVAEEGSRLASATAPAPRVSYTPVNIAEAPSSLRPVNRVVGADITPNEQLVAPINAGPGPRPVDSSIPAKPGQRGFTTSVQQSQNFSPELRKAVDATYTKASDAAAIDRSEQLMSQGMDRAHRNVLDRLQSTTAPDKQLIVDAGRVMQELDSKGMTAEAHNIHNLMSEKLTASGQTSQAAALVLRRSPEGLYYSALKDLQNAKVKVTPEIDKTLQDFKDKIRSASPSSQDRQIAISDMQRYIQKNIPSSATDKLFSFWRAGLLTGPRTVTKILTSHAVQLPLEQAKNVPAAGVDKLISLFTGQRSQVLGVRGIVGGLKEGAGAAKLYMRTGLETNPSTNALEFRNTVNFGSSVPGKIAQAYVDGVGRIHGSLYKPFYGAAHLESLYNQGKAAALTAGLKGSQRDAFIKNFVSNPSEDALNVAEKDAQNATFQQETALGKAASSMQRTGGVVGKVIAPFTRIPSAIATDVINYSPVGAVKTIVDGIKAARSDAGLTVAAQRQLSQGLGRSIVGTAAIVPGMALYGRGMMTLDYPTDAKEQQLWAEQGKQANAVLIDGKWRTLGSLGPLGSVLAMGGHLADSLQRGNSLGQAAIDMYAGALKSIESQSYLQGVSNAVNATQDPGRYLANVEKSYAGSVVPTGIATLASGLDKTARQVNTPLETIKSRIPGLRGSLPIKTDAQGKPIPNENGIGAILDPFYSTTNRGTDPLTTELQRLESASAGVSQPKITTSENFNSIKTKLSKPQAIQLQQNIGTAVNSLWNQAIADPSYQSLSDTEKQKVLSDISAAVTASEKDKFARANQLGQYNPNYVGKHSSAPKLPSLGSIIPRVRTSQAKKAFIRP